MAIDEKKLIEDCKKYLEGRYTFQIPIEYSIAMTRLCEIIEAQPKLSLETKTSDKWIPCSERLPDESMDSDDDDIVTILVATRFEGNLWFDGTFYMDIVDFDLKEKTFISEEGMRVVAWMPLPEAYKGE
jgi:hypothetical protein